MPHESGERLDRNLLEALQVLQEENLEGTPRHIKACDIEWKAAAMTGLAESTYRERVSTGMSDKNTDRSRDRSAAVSRQSASP